MIARLVLAGILASGVAPAQLQLFHIDAPGSEQPVGEVFDVGSVASGDILDTKFRIRNTGDAAATLVRLRVLGDRFWLEGHPTLPLAIKPGQNVDFRVRFHPLTFGLSYSAALRINDTTTMLIGSSPPSMAISVEENGEFRLLSSGETILFGNVERGSSVARRFRLDNPTEVAVTVSSLMITGDQFQAEGLPTTPLSLEPGESAYFVVTYQPETTGLHFGALAMDLRNFALEGVSLEPPYPSPEIVLATQTLASGQQSSVSVRLASPAWASGTGELRMKFRPAIQGAADDPAILFVTTGARAIPLMVQEGETDTQLGGKAEAVFQTGTTAGTITFTVELGTHSVEAAVTIPLVPVVIVSTSSERTATGLELRIVGFDNSHSASGIAFTFYDTSGQQLGAGPIRADVAEAFRNYFAGAQLGGQFSLTAAFPVAGDPALIGAVEVEFTSTAGISFKRRITF